MFLLFQISRVFLNSQVWFEFLLNDKNKNGINTLMLNFFKLLFYKLFIIIVINKNVSYINICFFQ